MPAARHVRELAREGEMPSVAQSSRALRRFPAFAKTSGDWHKRTLLSAALLDLTGRLAP